MGFFRRIFHCNFQFGLIIFIYLAYERSYASFTPMEHDICIHVTVSSSGIGRINGGHNSYRVSSSILRIHAGLEDVGISPAYYLLPMQAAVCSREKGMDEALVATAIADTSPKQQHRHEIFSATVFFFFSRRESLGCLN